MTFNSSQSHTDRCNPRIFVLPLSPFTVFPTIIYIPTTNDESNKLLVDFQSSSWSKFSLWKQQQQQQQQQHRTQLRPGQTDLQVDASQRKFAKPELAYGLKDRTHDATLRATLRAMGWTHGAIVAWNVAEVELASTPATLRAILHATLHRVSGPLR